MIGESTVLAAGIVLIVGIIGGRLVNYIKLPSVTGYIVAGLIVGPSVFNILSEDLLNSLEPVNTMALGVIAITIGGELTVDRFRMIKKKIPPIFFAEIFITFALVTIVMYVLSGSVPLAIVLGVLSLATAPAAIMSILKEYKAKGEFSRLLISLVALDNLLCIVGFGIVVSMLRVLFYQSIEPESHVLIAIFGEFLLSLLIGVGLGFMLVFVNRFSFTEDKLLSVNLGTVLLAVGFAEVFDLPSLLIAMLMGITVTNFLPNPQLFFKLFQRVEIPILIVFLTLAGAKLNLGIIDQVGVMALGYIIARLIGKIFGSRIGAIFSKDMEPSYRKNIGIALTPQAGVAIGLAVLAEDKLPVEDGVIITIILSTVIFFELVGPILVKKALQNCEVLEECEMLEK
ncbi:cation:proton antiporter [Natranaerofaba carboxydovora]|uniref:cation:proton antiporter n=1 Tax=Natranaerofaba carboxydovora TaxID=2742683 RepID=UPI001F133968|nr:cation:proton antiporter [Natranaerofaba carboxydovora]UMZ74257.1 Sodium/hydrogen exchanger family protein [Natranaerofaba carboxydovora]